MKILDKNNNISNKVSVSFITIILILTSLSSIILFTIPVRACHSLGTFESDYVTPKTTFLQGEIVYGKGTDSTSRHYKLRIRDPSDNVVYYSNPVHGMEVTGSWVLDDDAPTGEWDIQIGIFYDGSWHWSTDSGRIAYFDVTALPRYTLTININSLGTVTKDPDQETYTNGTLVQLTANPKTGWTFDHWSGDLNGSNNTETVNMTSNKTVTAHFTEDQYVLTININGSGTVSKNPYQETYTFGMLVNLAATANPGWTFSHWSGDFNSSNNPETINVTADKNITVHFKKKSTNGGGTNGGGTNGGDTNSGGTSTNGKSTAENLPPIADLSAGEPYQGYINSEITFDGSNSSDPDGYIISWKWDFGDGSNGEGKMATHSYLIAGTYTVILTVADNRGATNASEPLVLVIQSNRPPSNPEINGPTMSKKGIDYIYTVFSTDYDNDSVKYIIDWGDGNIDASEFLPNGTIFTITHKWTSAGSYTIKAIANDNQTVSLSEITVVIEETEPEEDNLALLVLAFLVLVLLILFLILSKRNKKKQ